MITTYPVNYSKNGLKSYFAIQAPKRGLEIRAIADDALLPPPLPLPPPPSTHTRVPKLTIIAPYRVDGTLIEYEPANLVLITGNQGQANITDSLIKAIVLSEVPDPGAIFKFLAQILRNRRVILGPFKVGVLGIEKVSGVN